MGFFTRRDSSSNNVPVVGYQDSADAQDVILWAAVQVTETGNTDADGNFQATNLPIIDSSHDWIVENGVGRQRLIDGKDITAHDSNNNPLYVGQVNGQTGVIPLYIDSEKTTSAANLTGVTVTYWTLRPLNVDSQGRLVVSLSGSLPAGNNNIGHVNVDSLPPLPAGTNNIGHVTVDSLPSLPTGSNVIGKAIIWNPLDAGGEQASVRIRDSAAGNTLTAFNYNQDNKQLPSTGLPLSVSSLPWLYNGDNTVSRMRNARYFKAGTATTTGNTNIWTPAAGKTVSLLGFFLISSATVTVQLTAGGSAIQPQIPLVAGVPVVVNFQNIWQPGSAGQAIGVQLSAAATVGVMMWGTEE